MSRDGAVSTLFAVAVHNGLIRVGERVTGPSGESRNAVLEVSTASASMTFGRLGYVHEMSTDGAELHSYLGIILSDV